MSDIKKVRVVLRGRQTGVLPHAPFDVEFVSQLPDVGAEVDKIPPVWIDATNGLPDAAGIEMPVEGDLVVKIRQFDFSRIAELEPLVNKATAKRTHIYLVTED